MTKNTKKGDMPASAAASTEGQDGAPPENPMGGDKVSRRAPVSAKDDARTTDLESKLEPAPAIAPRSGAMAEPRETLRSDADPEAGAPAYRWSRRARLSADDPAPAPSGRGDADGARGPGPLASDASASERSPSESRETEILAGSVDAGISPADPSPSNVASVGTPSTSEDDADAPDAAPLADPVLASGATPASRHDALSARPSPSDVDADIDRAARERVAAAARLRAEEEAAAAAEAAQRAEAEAREKAERDAFVAENSLGSLLFGARATAGKHDLKQVERDIRIKARYLDAIERVDPENLPADAYLAGYVRAYAAYLRDTLPLTPDEALIKFRRELAAKLGRDASDVAADRAVPEQAPTRVSAKVAPTIARDSLAAAKASAQAAARTDEDGGDDTVRRKGAGGAASTRRPTPAEALRARASAERADAPRASAQVARTRRAAPVDAVGAVERRASAARTEATPQAQGSSAAIIARRREAAAEREAIRAAAAEQARTSAATSQQRAAARVARRGFSDTASALAAGVLAVAAIGVTSIAGYSVLSEAQRVTAAPGAERPLTVVAQLDVADGASDAARPAASAYDPGGVLGNAAAFDRLTRVSAAMAVSIPAPPTSRPVDPLTSPTVLGAGPKAGAVSAPAQGPSRSDLADMLAAPASTSRSPGVLTSSAVEPSASAGAAAPTAPAFGVLALDTSWTRLRDGAGEIVFARELSPTTFRRAALDKGPFELRTGNAGGVAVVVGGVVYGPLGARGEVATLVIDPADVAVRFPPMPDETLALAARLTTGVAAASTSSTTPATE